MAFGIGSTPSLAFFFSWLSELSKKMHANLEMVEIIVKAWTIKINRKAMVMNQVLGLVFQAD